MDEKEDTKVGARYRQCGNCGHIVEAGELCDNCGSTWRTFAATVPAHDDVNSPNHYKIKHGPLAGKYEVIDVLESFPHVVGDGRLMQAVQYILRAPEKEGDTDLRKARWFLDRYLRSREG